jgi:uncharacterized delta-60 repeat protein
MRPIEIFCAGILLFSATLELRAQSWSHVVNLGNRGGSAIGGGVGNTLYSGLGSGEVLRSDDNGLTWTTVTNGLVDDAGGMLLPKAFVVTPTGRVIRGGDNASWRNRVGSPIFHSTNRGQTWVESPLPFGSPTRNPAGIGISDMVVHRGAVYFSDLLSEGVWRSLDDGLTWTAVGEQLPSPPFVGIAKVYNAVASAGDALLTVQGVRGVFRSADGGTNWTQSVAGIPGVANSPLVGGTTWGATDVHGSPDGIAFAVSDSRVFRSLDSGLSWTEVGGGVIQGPNPFVPSVIQPTAHKVERLGDRIYVATVDARFFEGDRLGEDWVELPRIPVGGQQPDIRSQSFYAHNGALYAAGTNGIHRLELGTAVRTPILPAVRVETSAPYVANIGGTIDASVKVAGTPPYSYEWQLDGTAIVGQTSARFAWPATGTNQNGTLSLVVRNAAGSATNTLGRLAVAPVGPGFPDYSFRPVPSSQPVTAIAFDSDGSVFHAGAYSNSFGFPYPGLRHVSRNGNPDPAYSTENIPAGAATILPLGDGSVLVGSADSGDANRYYRRLLPNGTVDAGWPWPNEVAGGARKIVRLEDGRFLMAGGSVGGIRRLLANGEFDPTFRGPGTIGNFQRAFIRDFALLPDGRLIVGGNFTAIDGLARPGLARLLPNGLPDPTWTTPLPNGSEVSCILVQADGRIVVGGAFSIPTTPARRNLVRLNPDGSLDTSVGSLIPATNPAGTVSALAAHPDGRIWVGGAFTGVSGRNYLFRLAADGSVDTSFPDIGLPVVSGNGVRSLALAPDGRLWIGTAGSTSSGFPYLLGNLFRIFTDLDGPTAVFAGRDVTPTAGSPVVLEGSVDGAFSSVQWRRNGTPIPGAVGLRLDLGSAAAGLDGSYELVSTGSAGSSTSAPVRVRTRGAVVIDVPPAPSVGTVSNSVRFVVNAFGREPLAYQWFQDGRSLTNATGRVLTLTNLSLARSGDYTVQVTGADGSSATSEPAFLTVIPPPGSAATGFRLGLFRTPSPTRITDLATTPDGGAVVGGVFATVTNGPNAMIARILADGSVDASFRFDPTGLSEFVSVIRRGDGRLVAAVRESTGGAAYRVIGLNNDGSRDATFNSPTVSFPSMMQLDASGGVLIAGGDGLIRLRPDGSPDTEFNARARLNGSGQSVSVDPAGRIHVTGNFTTVGGQARPQIARLGPDGTLDAAFAPTNVFSSTWVVTAVQDGVYVGDLNRFHRYGADGLPDLGFGWSSRIVAWDFDVAGRIVGILPTTTGDGVILEPDGARSLPVGSMRVPTSFSGYQFLRVSPDGSYWLATGAPGSAVDPSTLLYRLNGSVVPLGLLSQPSPQTLNSGGTLTLSASATGTSRVSYRWQRNGADLPGQTNATLVIPSTSVADTGSYRVVVSNRSGTLEGREVSVVVLGVPEILTQPAGTQIAAGDTFRLATVARGVAPLSYQWRRDGSPIPGAASASYTNRIAGGGDSGGYDVIVSNGLGSVTSAVVRVSVRIRPGALLSRFAPTNRPVNVKELNVLPDGRLLADSVAYDAFGGVSFSLPVTTTDLRERVAVHPGSERIYMVDGPRLAFDFSGAHIASVPAIGNRRLIRVEAGGTLLSSDSGISPTLFRHTADGVAVPGIVPAVHPVIDAAALPDGRIAVLTWTQETQGGNFAYRTRVARLNADGTLDAGFAVSTNVFPLGGRAERIAADPSGGVLVFGAFTQWLGQPRSRIVRLRPDGSPDPAFVPPVINGAVNEVARQRNGRLVVVGEFTVVDGRPRSLVARLGPDGSFDPSFDPGQGFTVASGQNVALDVKILPGGEIAVAGTFTHYDGVPSRGLAVIGGDSLDLYFDLEPRDVELVAGGSMVLEAAAVGTSTVSYQWYRDDREIPAATSPTLPLRDADGGTAGLYRVVAQNASGEISSRSARVDVVLPPVVVSGPSSQVVQEGTAARIEVRATGTRLAYRWSLDGAVIPGATNAVFEAAVAGRYSVAVSNPAGSVPGGEAMVRLRPTVVPPRVEVHAGPTNGLFARYRFEGGFASSVGSSGWGSAGDTALVAGLEGTNSVRLANTTSILTLGTSGTRLIPGSTYTVAFWIRPEGTRSLNVYSFVVGTALHYLHLGGDDQADGTTLQLHASGSRIVRSTDPSASVTNLRGRWSHVAVVYRGGGAGVSTNYTVLLDGRPLPLSDTTTNAVLPAFGLRNRIAGLSAGTGGTAEPFLLDDLRLFNRPLGEAEVASMFTVSPAAAAPVITGHPADAAATDGSPFEFRVVASGDGLFYEWFRDDAPLPEVVGPELRSAAARATDAGTYHVVVSNAGGSARSNPAGLQVSPAGGGIRAAFDSWAVAAGLTGLAADPTADPDGDGLRNLAEFHLGTDPSSAASRARFEVSTLRVGDQDYPTVSYVRRRDRAGLTTVVRAASTLAFDDDLGAVEVSVTPLDATSERVVLRSAAPSGSRSAQFLRVGFGAL